MADSGNVICEDSSKRVFKWQYRLLRWQIRKLINKRKRRSSDQSAVLGRICMQLQRAILSNNEQRAYLLGDLLKLAYGENLIRSDEQKKLMNLCVMAMRSGQDGIAIYLLETYTPLIKRTEPDKQPVMLEHFILLTYIAKKLNREYILDKIIDHIFTSIAEFGFSAANAAACCRVLKAVGIVAVKNHDYNTFCRARRSVGQLAAVHGNVIKAEFTALMLGWSHIILKRDYHEIFIELRLLCFEIKEMQSSGEALFDGFCRSAIDFSLMIASNRAIKCGAPFMEMVMRLAEQERQAVGGAVHFAVRTSRIAIDMHGVAGGFRFLHPLLEEGRRLTAVMQRFDSLNSSVNRRYLALLRHELITLLLVAARLENCPANKLLALIRDKWHAEFASLEEFASVDVFCRMVYWHLQKRRLTDRPVKSTAAARNIR